MFSKYAMIKKHSSFHPVLYLTRTFFFKHKTTNKEKVVVFHKAFFLSFRTIFFSLVKNRAKKIRVNCLVYLPGIGLSFQSIFMSYCTTRVKPCCLLMCEDVSPLIASWNACGKKKLEKKPCKLGRGL